MGRGQPDAGVEEIHPGRRDDQGHHHGRDQEGHDRSFVRHLLPAEAEGSDGAQSRRQNGREKGDDEAVLDRALPIQTVVEFLIPFGGETRRVEGQHLRREGEEGHRIEAQRHDDHDRCDEKEKYNAADDAKAIIPDSLKRARIGRNCHGFSLPQLHVVDADDLVVEQIEHEDEA